MTKQDLLLWVAVSAEAWKLRTNARDPLHPNVSIVAVAPWRESGGGRRGKGARAPVRAEQRDRALNEDVAHADACDAGLLAYDGDVGLNEREVGAAYHALHAVR